MTDHKFTPPKNLDQTLTDNEIVSSAQTGSLSKTQEPVKTSHMAKTKLAEFQQLLEDLHQIAPDMPEATVFAIYNDGANHSITQGIAFAPNVENMLSSLTTAVANTLIESPSDSEENRKAIIIQMMALFDQPLTDEFILQIRETMRSVASHSESEQTH